MFFSRLARDSGEGYWGSCNANSLPRHFLEVNHYHLHYHILADELCNRDFKIWDMSQGQDLLRNEVLTLFRLKTSFCKLPLFLAIIL